MGCFMSREDDQDKADLKTAKLVSGSEEEDRKARQEIEEEKNAMAIELRSKEKGKVRLEKLKEKGKTKQEDQQLAKTNKETFKDKGPKLNPKDDVNEAVNPPLPRPPASISDRGKSVIEGVKSVNPEALCCQICQGPFFVDEIPKKGKYHKHCYKEHRNPNCYVCKGKFPLTEKGRKYNEHQFWKQKYCPGHDNDGTPKCCSCERLEPKGTDYVMLEDYRMLCLKCLESSVMDSCDSYTLFLNIRGFFDDMGLKIEQEFIPILLVDKPALNKAETEEKIDYRGGPITRSLCLSVDQYVDSIKRPRIEPNNQVQSYTNMVKESKWVSGCEVAGILILYGLPRLLTGYILAHEMMHAWLRFKGYNNLKTELEEGLCQMLAVRWLESLTFAFPDTTAASSSSRTPLAATLSKKGDAWSDYEKSLQEFCIYQIKEDEVYGQAFKEVYQMMRSNNYSINDTLNEIVSASEDISKS